MKKIIVIAALLLGIAFGTQAQTFIGLNVGIGVESAGDNGGLTYGASADFGFLNTSFGTWGLFASLNNSIGTAGHTDLGIIHLSRQWRDRTSFIWGAGIDIRSALEIPYGRTGSDDGTEITGFHDQKGYGLVLRAGVSFKSHLYLTGSFAFGKYTLVKDIYSLSHTPAGLHYDGYRAEESDNSYYTVGLNIGYKF